MNRLNIEHLQSYKVVNAIILQYLDSRSMHNTSVYKLIFAEGTSINSMQEILYLEVHISNGNSSYFAHYAIGFLI